MERLSLDFMNSDWRDYRGSGRRADRLRCSEWLAEFVALWTLEVDGRPGPKALDALTALRDALWRIVERTSHGEPAAVEDLEQLNAALGASTPRRRVTAADGGYRIDLVPPKRDWEWVRSEIAADFADLLVANDPTRVKTCENDDCRWVFFDESKSRNRRWCASVCSNLIRVRRFRERHRDG
jgi:predicted RNA-binding Zn ribbon-like protein